jgi:hypothetical protein
MFIGLVIRYLVDVESVTVVTGDEDRADPE